MKTLLRALIGILVLSCPGSWARADNWKAASFVTASVTATSAQFLPANKFRHYLIVINQGSQTVYLKTGSAHVGTEGVSILAGGNWEPVHPPGDSIWLESATGTQTVQLVEGN